MRSVLLSVCCVTTTWYAQALSGFNGQVAKPSLTVQAGPRVQVEGAKFLCRLADGALATTYSILTEDGVDLFLTVSRDEGRSWETVSTMCSVDGTKDAGDGSLLQTRSGALLFAYRCNFEKVGGAHSYSIRVMESVDGGRTWNEHSVVEQVSGDRLEFGEQRGLWGPFLFETQSGKIQCYYDDENRPALNGFFRHQWITMETWSDAEKGWGNPVTVARPFDSKQLSRDGMPSVVQLDTGRLICFMEGIEPVSNAFHSVIRCVSSDDDGQTWSWRKDRRHVVYRSPGLYNSFAPHGILLESGMLAVIFSTDEAYDDPSQLSTPPEQMNLDVKMILSLTDGRDWDGPFEVDSTNGKGCVASLIELSGNASPTSTALFAVWVDYAEQRYFGRRLELLKQND